MRTPGWGAGSQEASALPERRRCQAHPPIPGNGTTCCLPTCPECLFSPVAAGLSPGCAWLSAGWEQLSANMRPGIPGFHVPDELGCHTHLFVRTLDLDRHHALFLWPGAQLPSRFPDPARGLLSLPTPRLPRALTDTLTWSRSGFWTPTHLVRLTLPLAGALGIHPEVGVHVVGADASVGIADGR